MKTTTLREIKNHRPCEDGWEKLIINLGHCDLDKPITFVEILKSNGIKDAFWALRVLPYKSYALLLADIAESVLHVFQKHCPNDNRPKDGIQAVRDYVAGKITSDVLAEKRNAVYDAACAAYAPAACAAQGASYSARAGAYAAYVAYDAAHAHDAAYARAAYTADAAYTAAAYSARAHAYDAGQWKISEKLFRQWATEGDNHAV